jgi:hypothetical protein
MKNVLRAAEGRFGVHDPILTEQRPEKGTEGRLPRKGLKIAWKSQLPFSKRSPQSRRELAPEHAAEHFHGQKECIAWMNPPLVIERKTTGRNHAMNMAMVQDVLPPCAARS